MPHILEVFDVPESFKNNVKNGKQQSPEMEPAVDALRKAGANVKFLNNSVIAIFKNANAANKALESVDSPLFKLKPWVAPVGKLHRYINKIMQNIYIYL